MTAAALLAVVVTGCSAATTSGPSRTAPAPIRVTNAPPAIPPTTSTSTSTSTAAPGGPPAQVGLQLGDSGARVLALQQHLQSLGYWLVSADGSYGDSTQQAVYALQKAAALPRDGAAGPATLAALARGTRPTIRSSGSGHRIEIQLESQLLLVLDGARVTTILSTSTGSGATFLLDGVPTRAVTPRGTYVVTRQVDANDPGPLGALWRPKYFDGGIAVHGLSAVPPYPASHGCARVSIAAMDMIWAAGLLPIGTGVTVV